MAMSRAARAGIAFFAVLIATRGDAEPRLKAAAPVIVPETVDALLETVRDLLGAERDRGNSLNSRGAGIAGFVGVILAVGGSVAQQRSFTGRAGVATLVLFIAALSALTLGLAIVVRRVLLPSPADEIAIAEVRRYQLPSSISQPKVMAQGSVLRGLTKTLERERTRNAYKAEGLKLGMVVITLGLFCIAAAASIVSVSHLHGPRRPNNVPERRPLTARPGGVALRDAGTRRGRERRQPEARATR